MGVWVVEVVGGLGALPAATPYRYTLPPHLTGHTLPLQLTATTPAVGSGVVGGGGCGWWRLWLVEVCVVEVVRGGRGRPGGYSCRLHAGD